MLNSNFRDRPNATNRSNFFYWVMILVISRVLPFGRCYQQKRWMHNGSVLRTCSTALSASLQLPTPPRKMGGLRRLPIVKRSTELIHQAKRVGFRILPDSNIKNTRTRVRKQGAERLNAVTLALCVPLRDVIQGYRTELRKLHPFERVVADLTVRARKQKDGLTLQHVLDDLNEARKEILIVGKDWIAKAKTAETARESSEIMVCKSSLVRSLGFSLL